MKDEEERQKERKQDEVTSGEASATKMANNCSGADPENCMMETKKSVKGILKPSSSFDAKESISQKKKKSAKWDEMNIIATLHPADKDYGFMKIDEAPTPYERTLEEEVDEGDALDAAALADKIRLAAEKGPRERTAESSGSDPEDDETPEQKAARKEFEMKRKAHYNEYYAAKLAMQLMEDDDDDDDDAEEEEEGSKENKDKGSPKTETPKKK